jgi:uncharacterized protein YjbI with pentapeptide repeats
MDCKMMGIKLIEGTIRNVRFNNCNLSYANFRFSNIKQVIFMNCLLRNGDFQSVELLKVKFDESDMKQIQMSGTKLKDIDLSTCDIEGIGIRIEELYGAIVSNIQVIDFAKLLGLVIKDE